MLQIQDPDNPDSQLMLEALIEACEGSIRGGGAFAFASASGVRLFLQDEVFVRFFSKNPFDLIVGVDAITDVKALDAIKGATAHAAGIKASAFLTERARSIFHPKLAWFRKKSGGCLITGSGNLTNGGLRSNWEGFSIEKLSAKEVDEVENHWDTFKKKNIGKILSISDPKIIEAATANAARAAADKAARKQFTKRPAKAKQVIAVSTDAVLVAEIPQSGNRWKQANFDLNTFQNFFQVRAGAHERVVFYHVDAAKLVHDPESRPSVSVKSQNYRFELEAAAGLAYPPNGRPIGVFRRIATRTFYYTLIMPGDEAHTLLDDFLKAKAVVPNASRMKRVVSTTIDLAKVWPKCPVLIDPAND